MPVVANTQSVEVTRTAPGIAHKNRLTRMQVHGRDNVHDAVADLVYPFRRTAAQRHQLEELNLNLAARVLLALLGPGLGHLRARRSVVDLKFVTLLAARS